MRPALRHAFALSALLAFALATVLAPGTGAVAQQPAGGAPIYLSQARGWTDIQRQAFYSQDQGSTLIPLAWLQALATDSGQPFLGDQLARYGYLANPASPAGLPVGFTTTTFQNTVFAGMTCAACHTREITSGPARYRIDGGPALVDFQGLLTDLVAAIGRIDSGAGFAEFASAVIGPNATDAQIAALKRDVHIWFQREETMRLGAYPTPDLWGFGRLDAVSMILNRVNGLDIGPDNNFVIAFNIHRADAPVRYPFIWNASQQDRTQWPGFAINGDNLTAMTRNLGEVYGVFATFHPIPDTRFTPFHPLTGGDFRTANSANFVGLATLENLIAAIPAPKWPWAVKTALVAQGARVFNLPTAQGGCAQCHRITPGQPRPLNPHTWLTPLQDVGTDFHEFEILHPQPLADTGVLKDTHLPGGAPAGARQDAFATLQLSVVDTLLNVPFLQPQRNALIEARAQILNGKNQSFNLQGAKETLKAGFAQPAADPGNPLCNKDKPYCYEARVLNGIWAAAPYLHNGSVPTLADLLEPVANRPQHFAVGPEYDPDRVGLNAVQPGQRPDRQTDADCLKPHSGNSRCGHEFGTMLSPPDKQALLEYLKTL